MNVKTIGLREVDADPGVGDLRGQLEQLLEVEITGIVLSQRAAPKTGWNTPPPPRLSVLRLLDT
jgi:hypothetical protein